MSISEDTVAEDPITSTLVPESERLNFLPHYFGERHFFLAEPTVYAWLDKLSRDYGGGFWEFYRLSNGGFYLAPKEDKRFHIFCDGNGFDKEVSADAAGIIANLFALNQIIWKTQDPHLQTRYEQLIDFADEHSESDLIFGAID